MLPRTVSRRLRATTVVTIGAVLAALLGLLVAPTADAAHRDPRRTRGLYVDPLMPAATRGGVYADQIGRRPQAFWVIPEAYPTDRVRADVRAYTGRAQGANRTPIVVVYGIPGRDCSLYSSGGLPDASSYRDWVRQIASALRKQHAMVVLEPDAIGFSQQPECGAADHHWFALLRFASKTLSATGAWVYLDAAHSGWTPYDTRPTLLKRAGIGYDRGFSTNVSNYRRTSAEKAYAGRLLAGLRRLGVTGKHYVVDTSRNGAAHPVDGDVCNPRWARIGTRPRLVFKGAFDGTLWVKHPGESDGPCNDGPSSGAWSDLLADRLLGRA